MTDRIEAAAFQIQCELGTTITAARRAAALALAAADAAAWQPIETAPKDDSILVCRENEGNHQVVFWDPEGYGGGPGWLTSDGPTFHPQAFTHWQPLPAGPATATEQEP